MVTNYTHHVRAPKKCILYEHKETRKQTKRMRELTTLHKEEKLRAGPYVATF